MNNPDETIKAGWSAEFTGIETWRDIGTFPTWWEAGMALLDDEIGWRKLEATELGIEDRSHDDDLVPDNRAIDVGIFHDPEPPENLVDADDIIDTMLNCCHKDYEMECAEDWLSKVPEEARADLTESVREVVGKWLDHHHLRPRWKVVGKLWTVTAGQIRERFRKEIAR